MLNSTSWAAASDQRLKTDVENSTVGLDFIKALRPITYKWAAKNAIDKGMSVMACIGEMLADREAGTTMDVCAEQLEAIKKALTEGK